MGAFEDYMNRPHPYHCGVGNCGPCEAKKRHDELASERVAGARDERARIAAKFRSRAAYGKKYAEDSTDEVGRSIAMVSVKLDENAAEWVEKGCP